MWKLLVASEALEKAAELWLWAQSVESERLFRESILKLGNGDFRQVIFLLTDTCQIPLI